MREGAVAAVGRCPPRPRRGEVGGGAGIVGGGDRGRVAAKGVPALVQGIQEVRGVPEVLRVVKGPERGEEMILNKAA